MDLPRLRCAAFRPGESEVAALDLRVASVRMMPDDAFHDVRSEEVADALEGANAVGQNFWPLKEHVEARRDALDPALDFRTESLAGPRSIRAPVEGGPRDRRDD